MTCLRIALISVVGCLLVSMSGQAKLYCAPPHMSDRAAVICATAPGEIGLAPKFFQKKTGSGVNGKVIGSCYFVTLIHGDVEEFKKAVQEIDTMSTEALKKYLGE
jgi:hypothetical protein